MPLPRLNHLPKAFSINIVDSISTLKRAHSRNGISVQEAMKDILKTYPKRSALQMFEQRRFYGLFLSLHSPPQVKI